VEKSSKGTDAYAEKNIPAQCTWFRLRVIVALKGTINGAASGIPEQRNPTSYEYRLSGGKVQLLLPCYMSLGLVFAGYVNSVSTAFQHLATVDLFDLAMLQGCGDHCPGMLVTQLPA